MISSQSKAAKTWDTVISTDDINIMFSSFLDTYLKTFYYTFPLKKSSIKQKT